MLLQILQSFVRTIAFSQRVAFGFLSEAPANKNSTCLCVSISSPLTHVCWSWVFKLARMWLAQSLASTSPVDVWR